MRVLIENLEPYRRYAIQVRGSGEVDTDWSPTYVIQTERDRTAPPQIPTISLEGSSESTTNWYWYDRNLVVTWGNYAVSDQSTWDHSHYMVQFVAHDDRTALFQTTDKKFVLTQALNAQNFGGKGLPAFKRISVWGVDRTGNPSLAGSPWSDGPDAAGTMKSTTYTSIINPPPTALENVVANFETRDLIFTWNLPSGNRNLDNEQIKISLNGGAKIVYIPANTNTWTLTYEENVFAFGAPGDPSITYELSVFDAFDQESAIVSGTATNLPPTSTVGGLSSVGIEGGIQTTFTEVNATNYPSYKDHKYIQIWEKVMTDASTTEGTAGSTTGYRKLYAATGGTEYAFIPDDPSFAYRWIRAQYVDWFEQAGPLTNSGGSYPVKMKSAVNIQAFAPPAPTNLAVTNSITGDALTDSQVYLTWTPPEGDTGEVLSGYNIQYQRVSPLTASIPSWTSFKVNAHRKYVQDIQSGYTKIVFADAHNFKVGDRVSIVNYGSMQHKTITSVEANAIYVSALTPSTIINNSFDRAKAGTAVVLSSATISLMPGTKYEFRVASESSTFTSEYSSTVTHTTAGNPLIAKRPLEIGTYFNPINITTLNVSGTSATVTTTEAPGSNGFAIGGYISITDCHANIDGRWPITNVSANTVTFTIETSTTYNAAITGKATAGQFALGARVNGVNNGLFMNTSNLWFSDTGAFRAGSGYGTGSWAGVEWNPTTSTFSTTGDVTARSGYFTGNVFLTNSGALVVGQSYKIDSTRTVSVSGSAVTIPVISKDAITQPGGSPMVQVLCSDGTLDTGGTPVPYASFNDTNKTITITKSGVTNGITVNGTIMVNAVTSMGERGLISTDATGKIKFMLSQSGLNRIGGWDITDNAIKSNHATASLRAGMSADPSIDSFWAGGDSGSAVFRVNEDGNMTLGNLSFKGTTAPARIYSGQDSFDNVNAPFYVNADGQFSLKNKFKIDVSGSNTKVTIGDTTNQQFFFSAGSTAKFYQGAGNFDNSDTKIYIDYNGNFSVSNFFRVTPTTTTIKTSSGGAIKFQEGTVSLFGQTLPFLGTYYGESDSLTLNNSMVVGRWTGSIDAGFIRFPTTGTPAYISGGQDFVSVNSGYGYDTFSLNAGSAEIAGNNLVRIRSYNSGNILLESAYDANISGARDVGLYANNGWLYLYASGLTTLQSGDIRYPNVPLTGAGSYYFEIGSTGREVKLYSKSSSLRFKKDVYYLNEEDRMVIADDILKLQPVIFSYKENPLQGVVTGYIAEDLESDGIDWPVVYESDTGLPHSIDYDKISIGLVELAKQQKQEIDTLNELVLQLEQRINALEEG